MAKDKGGRPTKMTKDTLNKLEEVFSLGGSDVEACLFADISHQALYNYQKKYPKYVERKAALKKTPVLKARRTIFASLSEPKEAQWYLEHKENKEFSTRTETENETTLNVKEVNINIKKKP